MGCDLLLNHWQADPESRSAVRGFGGYRSLMSLDDRVDNREAESISGPVGSGVPRTHESLEEMREQIGLDVGAVVADGQLGI